MLRSARYLYALLLFLLSVALCTPDSAKAVEELDTAQTIRALSFLRDRSTGTAGSATAAELVEKALTTAFSNPEKGHAGVRIGRHSFTLPVQLHEGSAIVFEDEPQRKPVAVRPLLMNALSTGTIIPEGKTGNVIYAGDGSLQQFNGFEVDGSIVLMDLDSGKNWTNAAMLGAAAVIFIDDTPDSGQPELSDSDAARNQLNAAQIGPFPDKLELTPIDFPRFWMSQAEAEAAFGPLDNVNETLRTVTLTSRTTWTTTIADNVWCFVPGTNPDFNSEYMMVQAFYDNKAYVPQNAPGADEAVSIATLLSFARHLADNPPERPVLLLATAGHAHAAAGSREAAYMLFTGNDELTERLTHIRDRRDNAERTLSALNKPDPLEYATSEEARENGETELLRQALYSIVKTRVDDISSELMRLRLRKREPEVEVRIRQLATQRMTLRRLKWVASSLRAQSPIDQPEQALTETLINPAILEQNRILADASTQLAAIESGLELKNTIGNRTMKAGFGLHLSSHGDGIGAFERGWRYELNTSVNRTRFFSPLNDTLDNIIADMKGGMIPHMSSAMPSAMPGVTSDVTSDVTSGVTPNIMSGAHGRMAHGADLWQATLRPSQLRPWQSFLPDSPEFSSEPFVLAGLPVVTLATTHDLRSAWGTPHDTVERVNMDAVNRQTQFLVSLLSELSTRPLPEPGRIKEGFATLEGNANLLRHGEVFPDKPAVGTVALVFQGPARFHAQVDTEGRFRIAGLINRKQTIHKAIIEAFRFAPDTGRATWAVDKPLTGKDNYRVKMRRAVMRTDLTMFSCAQTTLFNMLETRTLQYLYRPEIIDARTQTEPLRYWYSRMDTRSSTLGTLFLEPDIHFKLTQTDTLLGKKMLLLNSDEDNPMGKGFAIGRWPLVPLTEYRAARDMWHLLNPRVDNLEEHGIVNQRIRDLSQRGRQAMSEAEAAYKEKEYDTMFDKARMALSMASLVYNDIDNTQRDVLAGVLFYIALFVPFAYCLERLIFAFVDIHKRIVAFLGILCGTIGVIYSVHPAFQLTYSPLVVILAFFIIGLSSLVSGIIFLRFEREMEELQRRSMHMKNTEVSKWSAFAASMAIGVSNLRRRPVRSALTITTLVLLTFTIMNFTAAKSIRKEGWVSFNDTAPYNGLLLKQLRWRSIPVEALQAVQDMFGESGSIAPRVWYETDDLTREPVIPVDSGIHTAVARGVVGLAASEPEVSGMDAILTSGSWFTPEDRMAVLLPESLARTLHLSMDGLEPPTVTVWGRPFTVRGIFKDNGLMQHIDLDGEPVTPITYPNEAANQLSDVEAEAIARGEDVLRYKTRYEHVDSRETIIVPAATLLAHGGELKGIAIDTGLENAGRSHGVEDLGDRFGTMLFSGTTAAAAADNAVRHDMPDGAKTGTALYFASNATSYAGVSSIFIPLAISVLIVLNTMIGSVYERRDEISVYTSVGLAPSHVSFLFVAEALAFAVISVVFGYLVAQAAAAVLAGTPLWAGMTANYSSTAGVAAMTLVILVVLISVVYPSRVASQIAIPDVTRSWKLPEPEGDTMTITLPFLIKASEQACAGGFLMDYYNAHADISHGSFSTEGLACSFVQTDELGSQGIRTGDLRSRPSLQQMQQDMADDDSCFMMDLKAWLAPFDFGVRQTVKLVFCPSDMYKGFKQIRVILTREAGEAMVWQNLNRRFLNGLRKQLLVWRSIDDNARRAYENELEDSLRASGVETPDSAKSFAGATVNAKTDRAGKTEGASETPDVKHQKNTDTTGKNETSGNMEEKA